MILAIQVHQNSDVQRAQARAIRAQIRIDGASQRLVIPESLTASLKLRRGEPLTEMEDLVLDIDARVVLVGWQYIYGEFREGLIEREDVPLEDWRFAFASRPSFSRVWSATSTISFRPDFVAWMNENVVGHVPPARSSAGAITTSAQTPD